jgi:putative DNA primase/helicase
MNTPLNNEPQAVDATQGFSVFGFPTSILTTSGDGSKQNPPRPTVDLSHFPAELQQLKSWILWRYENTGKPKPDKIPYQINKTYGASTTEPATWSALADVLAVADDEFKPGIVANGEYVFLDLDACVVNGEIEGWAQSVILRCNSYTEFSPSETGVHIFVRGRVLKARKKNGCEIYSDGRYFTVTGKQVPGTPLVINTMTPEEIAELRQDINDDSLRPYTLAKDENGEDSKSDAKQKGFIVSRYETHAEREEKLNRALNCDIVGLYDSNSEAVHGVLQLLLRKHAGDIDKAVDEFEDSPLHDVWRDKWARLKEDEIENATAKWVKNGSPTKWGETFAYTDTGNAERFVDIHGGNFRYLHDKQKWLFWNGARWEPDASAAVHQASKATVQAMYKEASTLTDDDKRKKFMSHAFKSDSRAARENMVALARYETEVAANSTDFDSDPNLFNCANGTIDLRTGFLRGHDREDHLTKMSLVRFDPSAQCPRWLQFLEETFPGQPNVIAFLQRSLGYTLTGDTSEQCFWLLQGGGRNGKSTLLNAIQFVLGDYATATSFDTFAAKRADAAVNPRDGLAALVGSRFVRASESDEEKRFSEALLKAVTGGEHVRTARMYEDDFAYRPTFKIWLSTNHDPIIRGTDDGIWRRIHRLNFKQQVPVEKIDRHLEQKLEAEASGILNWMLAGLKAWRDGGLQVPAEVAEATAGYRKDQNPLREFIEDKLDTSDPNAEKGASELLASYNQWAQWNRRPKLTATSFGRAMRTAGIDPIHKREGKFYQVAIKGEGAFVGVGL